MVFFTEDLFFEITSKPGAASLIANIRNFEIIANTRFVLTNFIILQPNFFGSATVSVET